MALIHGDVKVLLATPLLTKPRFGVEGNISEIEAWWLKRTNFRTLTCISGVIL